MASNSKDERDVPYWDASEKHKGIEATLKDNTNDYEREIKGCHQPTSPKTRFFLDFPKLEERWRDMDFPYPNASFDNLLAILNEGGDLGTFIHQERAFANLIAKAFAERKYYHFTLYFGGLLQINRFWKEVEKSMTIVCDHSKAWMENLIRCNDDHMVILLEKNDTAQKMFEINVYKYSPNFMMRGIGSYYEGDNKEYKHIIICGAGLYLQKEFLIGNLIPMLECQNYTTEAYIADIIDCDWASFLRNKIRGKTGDYTGIYEQSFVLMKLKTYLMLCPKQEENVNFLYLNDVLHNRKKQRGVSTSDSEDKEEEEEEEEEEQHQQNSQ